MRRIYHEKELDEGDFLLFLYETQIKGVRLRFDYGLVTEVNSTHNEVFVKWFFDPCEANDDEDSPEVIENMPEFNGKFYLVKKHVPIHF